MTANGLINGMRYTIETAKDGPVGSPEDLRMTAAFGNNWRNHHDEILDTVVKMQNAKLKVADANPETFDRQYSEKAKMGTENRWNRATDAEKEKYKLKDPKDWKDVKGMADNKNGVTRLGSKWHYQAGKLHKAGTLIHELSHQVADTGDHIRKSDNTMIKATEASRLEENYVQQESAKWVAEEQRKAKEASAAKKGAKKIEQDQRKAQQQAQQSQKSSKGKGKKNADTEPAATSNRKADKPRKGKDQNVQASTSASTSQQPQVPQMKMLEDIQQPYPDGPVIRGGGCESTYQRTISASFVDMFFLYV
jgi:hypothetical protein